MLRRHSFLVGGHSPDIAMFSSEITNGSNPDVIPPLKATFWVRSLWREKLDSSLPRGQASSHDGSRLMCGAQWAQTTGTF